MRRKFVALAIALGLSLSIPALSRAAGPRVVGALRAGQSVFWDGGYVDGDPVHSLPIPSSSAVDRCATVGPCFEFALDLLATGADLRVALETPGRDDGFDISILNPSGTVVASMSNNNKYDVETFISNPVKGRYTIRVAPYSADYASFRMRAKLESAAYKPPANASGLLLPDLQVTRLWEFGFVAPANPLNGLFPPDDSNPPLDIAGVHPMSCGLDEQQNDGVSRCLRFSFGLANIGSGNFDVRFSSDRTGAMSDNYQCVQRAGGTVYSRHAGTSYFHQTHDHYHFADIILHQLYRVTNRTKGTLKLAGHGQKLGYSPADQSIPQWTRFVQASSGTSGSAGSCNSAVDNRLGLSRGWGDAYRYQRPGNYVDFGDNGDGLYVVQTTADPKNAVMEANDTNNTSYAYIRVEGDHVDVIETGHGRSPWDPHKEVLS